MIGGTLHVLFCSPYPQLSRRWIGTSTLIHHQWFNACVFLICPLCPKRIYLPSSSQFLWTSRPLSNTLMACGHSPLNTWLAPHGYSGSLHRPLWLCLGVAAPAVLWLPRFFWRAQHVRWWWSQQVLEERDWTAQISKALQEFRLLWTVSAAARSGPVGLYVNPILFCELNQSTCCIQCPIFVPLHSHKGRREIRSDEIYVSRGELKPFIFENEFLRRWWVVYVLWRGGKKRGGRKRKGGYITTSGEPSRVDTRLWENWTGVSLMGRTLAES